MTDWERANWERVEVGAIESSVVHLLRRQPFETDEQTIRAAHLLISRNTAQDYLDLAVMSEKYGVETTVGALNHIDEFYYDPIAAIECAAGSQVARQLGHPQPKDPDNSIDLVQHSKWSAWSDVVRQTKILAQGMLIGEGSVTVPFRNVDVDRNAPIEKMGFEAILAMVERGGILEWRRIVKAIREEPNGKVARELEVAVGVAKDYSPSTVVLLGDALTLARSEDGTTRWP